MNDNINRAVNGELVECMDQEATFHILCGQTEDHREASKAFVEKRDTDVPGVARRPAVPAAGTPRPGDTSDTAGPGPMPSGAALRRLSSPAAARTATSRARAAGRSAASCGPPGTARSPAGPSGRPLAVPSGGERRRRLAGEDRPHRMDDVQQVGHGAAVDGERAVVLVAALVVERRIECGWADQHVPFGEEPPPRRPGRLPTIEQLRCSSTASSVEARRPRLDGSARRPSAFLPGRLPLARRLCPCDVITVSRVEVVVEVRLAGRPPGIASSTVAPAPAERKSPALPPLACIAVDGWTSGVVGMIGHPVVGQALACRAAGSSRRQPTSSPRRDRRRRRTAARDRPRCGPVDPARPTRRPGSPRRRTGSAPPRGTAVSDGRWPYTPQ